MPQRERFLGQPTAESQARQALDQRRAVLREGPARLVHFFAAGVPRQVAHGLGVVPTGLSIAWATGAVYATQLADWTADLAYLIAPTVNTRARVRFFVDRLDDDEV